MLRGFLFGVTVAAAIGPIALLIINISLRHGAGAGIRAGLGAAVADLIYAAGAALVGGAILQAVTAASRQLALVASLFLLGFGAWMVWTALRAHEAPSSARREAPRPFLTTLALTLVNPLTMLVFAAFIAQGSVAAASAGAIALTVLGIFLGSLVVQLALALGAAAARGLFATGSPLAAINVASGLGIAAFGLAGLLGPA